MNFESLRTRFTTITKHGHTFRTRVKRGVNEMDRKGRRERGSERRKKLLD